MKKVIGCSVIALLCGVIVSDAEGMKVRKGADVYVGGAQLAAVRQEAAQAVQGARAVQDAVAAAADLNALAALDGLQPVVVHALEVVPLRTYGDNLLAIANNAGRQHKIALIKDLQRVADEYIGGGVNNGLLAVIADVENENDTSSGGGAALNDSYNGMNAHDLGRGALNTRTRQEVIEDILDIANINVIPNAINQTDTRWHLIRVIAEIAETGQVGGADVADTAGNNGLGYGPEVIRALAKVVNGF